MRFIHSVIHTVSHGVLEDGYLEIENGRIKAVGETGAIRTDSCDIDLEFRHITPGLIDAHTSLGLKEDSMRYEGNDWDETGMPVAPMLRAVDGFNPADRAVEYALSGGVTAVGVSPGNANVIGGQIAAVRLSRSNREQMIINPYAAMKFSIGEASKRKNASPVTRMAIGAMIRDALERAHYDETLCDLLPVLSGDKPAFIHAEREDDIVWAIQLGKRYGMNVVIVNGSDSAIVAGELRKHSVPVILGSLLLTASDYEVKNMDLSIPRALALSGVEFALTTDHHMSPVQLLSVEAALSAGEGLDRAAALASITIVPAVLLGIDSIAGSIDEGKEADFVIWSGNPFSFESVPERVFVLGKEEYRHS